MQGAGVKAADRAAVSLQPDEQEVRLGERALAVARAVLAIAAVSVGYIMPPLARSEWVQLLMMLYAVYAVIVLFAIVRATTISPRFPQILQAVDVGYVGALATVPVGGT